MILRIVTISFVAGTLTAMSAGAVRSYRLAADHIRRSLPVMVFFQPTLLDTQARMMFERMRQSCSGLESSAFVSAEEAAEEARKDPLLSRSMMLLNTNPFPASAEFILSFDSWANETPRDIWGRFPGIREVRWDRTRQQVMHGLLLITQRYDFLIWTSNAASLLWAFAGFYAFAKAGLDWGSFFPYLFWGGVGGTAAGALYWFTRQTLTADVVHFWAGPFPVLPVIQGSLVTIGMYRARS